MFAHGSASLKLFLVVWIFLRFLGVICYGKWGSQLGSQKLLQGMVSHEFTAYLSIFNLFKLNKLWSYYQKHVKQIILNRTTLWSLALRIFEPSFEFSWSPIFLESNSEFVALRETNLDDSTDSGNFFVTGYLPLILVPICMVSQFM